MGSLISHKIHRHVHPPKHFRNQVELKKYIEFLLLVGKLLSALLELLSMEETRICIWRGEHRRGKEDIGFCLPCHARIPCAEPMTLPSGAS